MLWKSERAISQRMHGKSLKKEFARHVRQEKEPCGTAWVAWSHLRRRCSQSGWPQELARRRTTVVSDATHVWNSSASHSTGFQNGVVSGAGDEARGQPASGKAASNTTPVKVISLATGWQDSQQSSDHSHSERCQRHLVSPSLFL